MNRIKGIIAAGTLTGLILITAIVLGFGQVDANGGTAVLPANTAQVEPAGNLDGAEAVQAWQDYSSQLENTVSVLQQRETTYQTQLETANSTIRQLEQQVNGANQTQAQRYEEHEDHEHEEHEGFFDD